MSINGKYEKISRRDLLEFASRNNIKEATEIIDKVKEIASGWRLIAKEYGVPEPMINAIFFGNAVKSLRVGKVLIFIIASLKHFKENTLSRLPFRHT